MRTLNPSPIGSLQPFADESISPCAKLATVLADILTKSFKEAFTTEEQHLYQSVFEEIQAEFWQTVRTADELERFGWRFGEIAMGSGTCTLPFASCISLPNSEHNGESCIRACHNVSFDPDKNFVAVLLPVRHGSDKILKSLTGLALELEALGEGYQYEINICLNNSRDNTFAKITRFKELFPRVPLNIYEFDREGLQGTGQIFALNLLVSDKREEAEARKAINVETHYYLHLADDDIGYIDPPGGILSNIRCLETTPSLKAISGTCCWSKEATGFHSLISVRKNASLLRNVGPFPQVYGGALTVEIDNFPTGNLPSDTSLDAYITLRYLREYLSYGGQSLPTSAIPIRTNPDFLVEHRETHTFPSFVARLVRDIEWRKKAVRALEFQYSGSTEERELEQAFITFRRRCYDVITRSIDEGLGVGADSNKLFQRWMAAIRSEVKEKVEKGQLFFADFPSQLAFPIPCPEHHFAYFLTANRSRLESLLAVLRLNRCFTIEEEDELCRPEVTEKVMFKILERAVRREREYLKEQNYFDHSGLYLIDQVIQSSDRVRTSLDTEEIVHKLFERAGIDLGVNCTITPSKLGRSNFSSFVRGSEQSYFIRYHDPLGKEFFSRYEPRKATFICILCEHLFSEILGPDGVVKSLYPSLELAKANYFGVEEISDFEKLCQRTVLQLDQRRDNIELSRYAELGLTFEEATVVYAKILGRLHRGSLGVAHAYNNETSESDSIIKLLKLAKNDIRFSKGEDFSSWLCGNVLRSNWITRIFKTFDRTKTKFGTIFSTVQDRMSKSGLSLDETFSRFCEESQSAFDSVGTLGHLDYKLHNTFVSRQDPRDPKKAKIFDFDLITFVDPMYESGQSLYSILKTGIIHGEIKSLTDFLVVCKVFNRNYFVELFDMPGEGRFLDTNLSVRSQLSEARSNFFAGFSLVCVMASEGAIYNLSEEQKELVQDGCYDLLRYA